VITLLDEIYHKKHSDVHQTFLNRRLLTIQNLLNDLLLDEECIGFQFWLGDEIAELSKRHKEEWMVLQKQIAHELYLKNTHYIYSALELACAGLCDPCYNLIRTIHESVLKMYYLFLFPQEAEEVHNDMEPDNKSKKYNHNFLNQQLYSEQLQQSMRNQFRELSAKVHANYAGVGSTFTYSTEQIKDCLWFLRVMSFYNIVAEIENQALKPSIIEQDQLSKINQYLEKLRQSLVDEKGNMATYFPDKPELLSKLRIRPGYQ
jgi:hypothetical protein